MVIFYTTGMGLPVLTSGNEPYIVTACSTPWALHHSAAKFRQRHRRGSTADVIQSTLLPGSVGLFEVVLHLSPGLGTNGYTAVTVAQGAFVSNPVSIPVVAQQ